MDFDQLIQAMTPDIHAALKRAIEVRKWPNGEQLTEEQMEICMQAVIKYDHLNMDEGERVGYIDRGEKTGEDVCASSIEQTSSELKWLN